MTIKIRPVASSKLLIPLPSYMFFKKNISIQEILEASYFIERYDWVHFQE